MKVCEAAKKQRIGVVLFTTVVNLHFYKNDFSQLGIASGCINFDIFAESILREREEWGLGVVRGMPPKFSVFPLTTTMYIYHAFINALSTHMIHAPAKERSMQVMLKAEVFCFFSYLYDAVRSQAQHTGTGNAPGVCYEARQYGGHGPADRRHLWHKVSSSSQ